MNLKKELVINSIILLIFFKRSPMPVINTTRSLRSHQHQGSTHHEPFGVWIPDQNVSLLTRLTNFKNESRLQTAIKDWNFWVMQFWTF